MFRFICLLIPSVMLVGLSSDLAYAQPGGESRSRGFMSFLDRNKNGVIEASEFDQMPGRFKETLQAAGVDTSRSMSQQEFERVMPQVMEQMRSQRGSSGGDDRGRGGEDRGRGGDGRGRGGDDRGRFSFSRGSGSFGGGPPGSFSRRDESSDEDRGGSDRGAMRDRYGSFQSDRGTPSESSSDSRSRGGSKSNSSSKNEPVKPVRTTVDLNKDFVPHDTDLDGQIGLYEWRKNNPTKLGEFFTMDLNGDGYLTPREIQLSKDGKTQRSAASFMFALNTGQQTGSQSDAGSTQASTTPDAKTSGNEKPTPAGAAVKVATPASDPIASQAGYFFKLVDRDKDSTVSPEEWKKSRSMRRMFEGANIDLTQPMSQEQFISHYLAIKKN
tara:strand:- start:2379 stop:3530 length:1152 start_codon:yes stop_codon:yes gene_type:complete